MTQTGTAQAPEPQAKEKVLDFRAQNRTYNSTEEIRSQRYNFSKSVIQEFEDEFELKRELRETARERHYQYYNEKPPSEQDESDHECPYPLWVSPNLRKVPPKPRNPTVPEPFAFDQRPKRILPNTRERRVAEMVQEKKWKDEEELNKPPFQAIEVPPECKIPLYDHMLAEQEQRRQLVKELSVQMTLANEKPFSFYNKYEKRAQTPPARYPDFVATDVPDHTYERLYEKMCYDD